MGAFTAVGRSEFTDLATDQAEALGMTLVQIQNSLVKKLGSNFQHPGRLQKTSVVGGSRYNR